MAIRDTVMKKQYLPKGYIPHHDVNNGTFQLVLEKIHKEFTHIGGHSLCGGN